jgi:hypothetical protein
MARLIRMMRGRLVAIVTGAMVNLVGANADGARCRAYGSIKHGHCENGDNHAGPVGSRCHDFHQATILVAIFIVPATAVPHRINKMKYAASEVVIL